MSYQFDNVQQKGLQLFLEKGYAQTTIEVISKASEYSRRTIYAYCESKDDILHPDYGARID